MMKLILLCMCIILFYTYYIYRSFWGYLFVDVTFQYAEWKLADIKI